MKKLIQALQEKNSKLAIQVKALSSNEKKMVAGILQTIKALNKFKTGGLNLLIRAREGGKTTETVKDLVDELLSHLESYDADLWK